MMNEKGVFGMALKITEMPNEPILICEISDPYNPVEDSHPSNEAAHALYQRVQGPIHMVIINNAKTTFSDTMIGIATVTRGEKSLRNLPITLYAMGDINNPIARSLMEAIVKGLYGGINFKLVKSTEEALAMIRAGK
jgi:hypothetical protein